MLLTLDWLWGRPQALLQRRNVSSVRVGLANGTKRTPSQNWGNLLSELHVPHRQCLAGISNAFSASFTSIWPSFPRFYCTPNKACLLCATPAGTYRVQSPGFPKIVYYDNVKGLETHLKITPSPIFCSRVLAVVVFFHIN